MDDMEERQQIDEFEHEIKLFEILLNEWNNDGVFTTVEYKELLNVVKNMKYYYEKHVELFGSN